MTEDEKNSLQARFDMIEWSLHCLSQGEHKLLQKLLSGITSKFRVITDSGKLEKAHISTSIDKILHEASRAIGTIRTSLENGVPELTVYSFDEETDPGHALLLAKSQREILGALFDALSLQSSKQRTTSSPFHKK